MRFLGVVLIIVLTVLTTQAFANQRIQDKFGRDLLFRGVNARVKGIFDVDFNDGRKPLEHIPTFDSRDTTLMRKVGFNLLRLPINWSGIEPLPDLFNPSYVAKIIRVLDLCQKAGIKVIVDMHQDAYSKEIGEDGAPYWAIVPQPTVLNEGGYLKPLMFLRVKDDVQSAFASFWLNEKVNGKGLQEHYIESMLYVLKSIKSHPALLGMEIFNEPWLLHITDLFDDHPIYSTLNLNHLYNFYAKAIPQLQEVAKDKWIFFEPDAVKFEPTSLVLGSRKKYSAQMIPNELPWNPKKTVYSPHLYTRRFLLNDSPIYPVTPNDIGIKASISNSIIEADLFKTPLFIGEFGFTHKAKMYAETYNEIMRLADEHIIHTAQWLWKEKSQHAWGYFDYIGVSPIFRKEIAIKTARAYPESVSGELLEVRYEPVTKHLEVDFIHHSTNKPNVVFLPIHFGYPKRFMARCNGFVARTVKLDKFGRFAINCGSRDGGEYTLSVSTN